jgi:hypothetical protein
MTRRAFEKLAREHFLPLLPGFEVKKGLLFETPIGYLLRGLTYQPSQYDRNALYLSVFVQALYVPEEDLIGTHGERTPVLDAKEIEEMRAFVLGPGGRLLDQLRTPADLAKCLERREKGHPPDPRPLEALAFSQLLSGRTRDAERVLDVVETSARELIQSAVEEGLYTEDERHPLQAVLERTEEVREALAKNTEDAIGLLEQWREETARNLGLSDHLAPSEPAQAPLSARSPDQRSAQARPNPRARGNGCSNNLGPGSS